MGDIDRPSGPNVEGPDADGFYAKTFDGPGFNGTFGRILCRPEGEDIARVRIGTGPERANPHGALHGGFLLAFLDQAVFVGPITIGRLPPNAVVSLAECTTGQAWCRISGGGPNGWVPGSFLVGSAAKNRATPWRPLVNPFARPNRRFPFGP